MKTRYLNLFISPLGVIVPGYVAYESEDIALYARSKCGGADTGRIEEGYRYIKTIPVTDEADGVFDRLVPGLEPITL